MFSRSEPEPQRERDDAPSTPPVRREARDARVFEPSSFASRRAERAARGEDRRDPRLVSLGRTEYRLMGSTGQPNRIAEVEMLFDADSPNDFYVRHPGTSWLEPIQRGPDHRQEVVSLGTVRARDPRWTPTAGSALPDRRVALSDG